MAHVPRLPVPTKCDICGSKRIRIETVVREFGAKRLWTCDDCSAATWCHKDSDFPMGLMASRHVRGLRASAHKAFDKLWQEKFFDSRDQAYKWMSIRLCVHDAHIGTLTELKLKELLHLCKQFESKEVLVTKRRVDKKNDRIREEKRRSFNKASSRRKNKGIAKQERIKEHSYED